MEPVKESSEVPDVPVVDPVDPEGPELPVAGPVGPKGPDVPAVDPVEAELPDFPVYAVADVPTSRPVAVLGQFNVPGVATVLILALGVY